MNIDSLKIRHCFAYYLPQYHEIKENNEWWGEGFTEWVKVKQAKKYHKSQIIHHPHSSLGYYELNNAKVIAKQYSIAKKHNIDTFCFWHYWFSDNEMLLEKPAELILDSQEHVEFCFAWANHSWYNKSIGKLLKLQTYDYSLEKHFNYLLPFFLDDRYRKINNKPVFFIYDPHNCKNLKLLINYFNEKIRSYGFDGVFFVFEKTTSNSELSKHCDLCLNSNDFMRFRKSGRLVYDKFKSILRRLNIKVAGFYSYSDCIKHFNAQLKCNTNQIPIVFPGWDTTIRHANGGICFLGNTPDVFEQHLSLVANHLSKIDCIENRYIVIKSWNEWAEGNFIEPSEKYAYTYLSLYNKYFEIEKPNE